jgi:hypothetical protein
MHSIIIDGVERFLGNRVPTSAPDPGKYVVYGDTPQTPLVARSQWEGLVGNYVPDKPDHPNLPYVHDQDGIGQCNPDATTAAEEFTRSVMGLDFVKLSAGDLYGRINGGRDQGSLLEDALAEMDARGVGTAATYGGTLWNRSSAGCPAQVQHRSSC